MAALRAGLMPTISNGSTSMPDPHIVLRDKLLTRYKKEVAFFHEEYTQKLAAVVEADHVRS